MTDLIYDSGQTAGEELHDILMKLDPEDRVLLFSDKSGILKYADSHIYHTVFVCLNGVTEEEFELSSALLNMIPGVNLIFLAEDEGYIRRALNMHASGYILLPLDEEKVRFELGNLLYPVASEVPEIIVDHDKYEIFIDGKPVSFAYSRTKELFMLLLRMDGAMVRNEKMMDYIFEENKPQDKSRSYLQNLRSDLIHTLALYGLDGAVCHRRGSMWLDRTKFTITDKGNINSEEM